MNRAFTNILSDDPNRTAAFYEGLLGMTRHYDSDWFVILTHPDVAGLEFGILQRANEIVPETCRAAPAGVILTFVVDALEPVEARAEEMGVEVIQTPTRMPYGQTRLLVRDPDGTVVDISCPS